MRKATAVMGLIGFAAILSFLPAEYALSIFGVITLVVITWAFKYPLLYLTIFLIPFVGLTFNFSEFAFLRSLPFIGVWDAPIGDFIALTITIVFGMYLVHYERVKHIYHHIKDHLPAFKWYVPFLLVAILSIFRAPRDMQMVSLQYFMRFVLFTYIAFVALPFWMVRTKKHLRTIIHVFVWSGILVAIFGAISLFVGEPFWGIWRRVSPFVFAGIAPIGTNHNLLSEFLVTTIPLTFYVATHTHEHFKKWYMLAGISMIIITLLTFGRTAWIVLVVQLIALWWFIRPRDLSHKLLRAWPLLIVGAILVSYMAIFSASDFVKLSTDSRLDLTRFSLIQAAQTPWIGRGIGTFIPTLGLSTAFSLEYGGPIEAHGFGQKLLFETGIIGLVFFIMFFMRMLFLLARTWHESQNKDYRNLILATYITLIGALAFQVFNTSYFNAKLWFPVGLAWVVLYGKWKFNTKT